MLDGQHIGASWKARFSSTEPTARVRIGNDCGNGRMSYRRKGMEAGYLLENVPFSP